MKNNNLLKELHVGSMIKEIVDRQSISAKQVAEAIDCYTENGDKIYKLKDMDGGDIAKISYLSGDNLLEGISENYLSITPYIETKSDREILKFTMNTRTNSLTLIM